MINSLEVDVTDKSGEMFNPTEVFGGLIVIEKFLDQELMYGVDKLMSKIGRDNLTGDIDPNVDNKFKTMQDPNLLG